MTRDDAIFTMEYFKLHFAKREAVEAFDMAIKALEQEPILDKIRAEIETDLSHFCFDEWGNENPTWKEIKVIIDKYKAESEEKKEGLKYCDRNICVSNEYSGIGCDECMVNAESEEQE